MSDERPKKGRPADPASKRSRGEDRHKGERVVFYLDTGALAELDAYVSQCVPATTRAAVLRLAIERFLAGLAEPPAAPAPKPRRRKA